MTVSLRPVREEDLPALYPLYVNVETAARFVWTPLRPRSFGEFRDWYVPRMSDERRAEFAVVDGDAVLGRCGLKSIDPFAGRAEFAIALLPGARGRGVGTSSLRRVAEFAFLDRNLRRLYLHVLASNTGAVASYRKVGFVEEGRLREHVWVGGCYDDVLVMGLLRADWRESVRDLGGA